MADNADQSDDYPIDNTTRVAGVREAPEDSDQLLQFWGMFWGRQGDFLGVFDVTYNLDKERYQRKEYRVFENTDPIEDLSPTEDESEFRRQMAPMSSSPSVPDTTIPQVNSFFTDFLEDDGNTDVLVDALMSHDERTVHDTLLELVRTIYPSGEIALDASISLTPEADEGTQDFTEDEEEQVSDDQTSDVPEPELDATASTDPVHGKQPRKLSLDQRIYVHLKGDIVQKLPEELQHDRYEELTTPMSGRISYISEDVAAPDDVDEEDFNASNLWEVHVDLDDFDNRCKALINVDTLVKTEVEESESNDGIVSFLFSPYGVLLSGLIIVIGMVLSYFLFGY